MDIKRTSASVHHRRMSGFTLVELMVGTLVMVLVFAGAFVTIRTMMLHRVMSTSNWKAEQKLRNVAEHIRNEGTNDQFDTMDQPTPTARDTDYYPEIKVFSTIGPINPVTRTRTVVLTATWNEGFNGSPKTKTQTFTIARIRGKSTGASVKVKVTEITDGDPVPKVRITAVGQDQPIVYCDTDGSGTCTLTNVMLGAGVVITADGQVARHYFDNNPSQYPSPSFSFTKPYTLTGVTSVNAVNDELYTSPIQMYPPGHVTGSVKDVLDDSLLSDCTVYLKPEPGMLKANLTFGGADIIQKTDGTGVYHFDWVMPGNYSIYLIGSSTYAALAKDNDYNTHGIFLVGPDAVVTKDFRSIPMGGVKGKVHTVHFSGGLYRQGSVVDAGVPVRLKTTLDVAYHPSLPGHFSFNQSVSYVEFFGPMGKMPQPAQFDLVTDGSGRYRAPWVTPRIISYDNVNYPYVDQFAYVSFVPGVAYVSVPSPLTPIMVLANSFPADKDNVLFVFRDTDHTPVSNPPSISPNHLIHTNGFSPNPDITLDYLDRNEMVQVDGQVRILVGGVPTDFNTTGFELSEVHAQWGAINAEAATGGIITNGDASEYFAWTFYKGTYMTGGKTFYDMSNSGGENALPPNIGNDYTVLLYHGRQTTSENKMFTGQIQGSEKVYCASCVGFATNIPIPAASMNLSGPPLQVSGYDGTTLAWTADMTFSGGIWQLVNPQPVKVSTDYNGKSAQRQLPPGTHQVLDILVDPPATSVHQPYYIKIENDSLYRWYNNSFPPGSPTAQPKYTYNSGSSVYDIGSPLLVTAIGQGRIYGRVHDPLGKPIIGATITLHASGIPTDVVKVSVDDSGCGSCSEQNGYSGPYPKYQYVIDPARFAMTSGINYVVTVSAPGYVAASQQIEAYKNIQWQADFNLLPPPIVPPPPGTGFIF